MQVGSLGGAVTEIMAKRVVVLVLAIVMVVPPLTFTPEDHRHQIALDYLESKVYGLQAMKNETSPAKPAGEPEATLEVERVRQGQLHVARLRRVARH